MGYPRHYHLTWGGGLFGTEQWACGLRIVPDGAISQTDGAMVGNAETALPIVRDKVNTFFLNGDARFNGGATLTWVKYNVIGSDGRYINDATVEYHWPAPVASPAADGSPAGGRGIPQAAVAVTLDTGHRRGLAHVGRFFIPISNLTPDLTGRLSAVHQTGIANAASTFLEALGDWPGVDPPAFGKVAVVSRGRALSVPVKGAPTEYGQGVWRIVTGVRVGRVIDTITRRRNALAEDYYAVDVSQ